eukprot:CAMPEP_0119036766 /NCGR_PEP_ID=MMETSP1177-20130426/4701_1 /TAXON_ID=2985 /ORGANISM="Ochromonas sp, Strain CCMP1899" /LENGTH=211 /DNA_ID=CAMNT_0006997097 /DNA_START=159 /DNA_END=794 /DNA_ORIENTATION=-
MTSENGSNDGAYSPSDWTKEEPLPIIPKVAYQRSSGDYSERRPLRVQGYDEEEEDCCCFKVDPVLCWFTFFHSLSGCVGLATLAANIYVLARTNRAALNYKEIIMRSYACIFCIIIILTETNWRYIMKRIRILDIWFLRGFFYFYVGFITIEGDLTFTQPQDIIGLVQISFGALYILMGILCIKSMKMQRLALADHRSRENEDYDAAHASV